jgi:hypothetical protein
MGLETPLGLSRHDALSEALCGMRLFALPLDLVVRLSAASQISVHVGPMAKVIAYDRMNVGERNGIEALRDLLGGIALPIELNDRIERHAGAADAYSAVGVGVQGYRGLGVRDDHDCFNSIPLPADQQVSRRRVEWLLAGRVLPTNLKRLEAT